MTVTLDTLRARAALLLDGERFVQGTLTAASPTSATDTSKLLDTLRGKFYKGRWLLRTAPMSAPAIAMSDYVTRLDDASSPGVPDTPSGISYVPVVGTWGRINQRIYSVTDTNGDFLQLSGAPLSFTFSSPVSGTVVSPTDYRQAAFAFGYVDASNYLFVHLTANNLVLTRRIGGGETNLVIVPEVAADGTAYTIQVDKSVNASGETVIVVWFNTALAITYTLRGIEASTFANVATQGLLLRKGGAPATAARWGVPLTLQGLGTAVSAPSDRERRIAVDTPSTGTLTVTPAWSGTPNVGEAYEISSVRPSFLEASVNRALERMAFVTYLSIPGVAGQKQYALSAYPWLTSESQLYGVERQIGPVSNAYDYLSLDYDTYTNDADVLTLNLAGGVTIGATDVLRLKVRRSFASLGTLTLGADTVALPNLPEYLDWAAWEIVAELFRSGVGRLLSPEFSGNLAALASRVSDEVARYRADLAPEPSRDLFAAPALPFWPSGSGFA